MATTRTFSDFERVKTMRTAAVFILVACAGHALHAADGWKVHEVYSGQHCNTAVAGDFTGDGKADVICLAGGKARLLTAPDWKETILEEDRDLKGIHSSMMDVDGDGDLDFIGCQHSPGVIFWLENPEHPLEDEWKYHLIDDRINGVHGLIVGDVNGDGRSDLVAISALPTGQFANSVVWYTIPQDAAKMWNRHIAADGDAPGLSHYMGIGDVNGDGRADIACAAKGGDADKTKSGEWFAWWLAPKGYGDGWKKEIVSDVSPGATNIHPVDVNGDGKTDFIASQGHSQGVFWFEGPKWKRHTIDAEIEGPHCLVAIDMDGDGDIDAATCGKDSKTVAWYENNSKGEFTIHPITSNQAAYDIRAFDMDGDGDLDLIIAGQASKNVVWCENPRK